MQKTETIAARITPDLLARVKAVTNRGRNPYAPTMSQLFERGIQLAVDELEKTNRPRKQRSRR